MEAAEPHPSTEPTPEALLAAARWALDHDHQALLAHRVARLSQAPWDVQDAADRHLIRRHREAALTH
ncbi:hypothetical protein GCM10007967_16490 [Xylanimonas ulmi]